MEKEQDALEELEREAIRKLSEALSIRNSIRWAKATPAQRAKQGKLLAAGRRKAKRGKK